MIGIEDLCTKRDELQKQILSEEEEKTKIQNDIRILTERLAKINEGLARKIASRNEYDKTIAETEAAYMKILESSQTLLHVLKNETSKEKSPLSRSQNTMREKSREQQTSS
ncbi:Sjoegren syndrome nuclear autoantigen 1 homolog [Exaiptasia diaphana]|uniref:Sjoegren syndrome nuclear autoantigen 1 n=1 Tax=Exaiptasia diaphana TaxID=2652724 RepID=A0A913X330_EXADI|nr:Sjoegren syndrome nuclear autoantigen 1 homolog [Exaiptasia diaphana]XP_020897841.1 Sjoegren syndrome nuclear autoantigen 1 homolog [Exaiptasia diaphana]KXJ27276.1 Sjoegren syndrome nuclear autoantigen 1-like [Exaiptasia diaphana]KXJ27368.1 Sjoegren syndrome nuclear autoantigen 1-like [Exaiptasia diaphana]